MWGRAGRALVVVRAPAPPPPAPLPLLRARPAARACSSYRQHRLQLLHEDGFAYPHVFRPSVQLSEFAARFERLAPGESAAGEPVSVAGRVVSRRESGKRLLFLDLEGGLPTASGRGRAQVVLNATHLGAEGERAFAQLFRQLHRGDIIGVRGVPKRTTRGELSVVAHEVELLAPCVRPFPETHAGPVLEHYERSESHMHLLTNPVVRRAIVMRAKILAALRRVMGARDFLEVETPILSTHVGGANAFPFTTKHRMAEDAELFMRIAPELALKQCVIGGLERVFEIGKSFRNEGVDATHYPEFTTMEAYWAYADRDDMMALAEEVFVSLWDACGRPEHVSFATPFRRVRITEALQRACEQRLPDDLASDAAMRVLRPVAERAAGRVVETPEDAVDTILSKLVEPTLVEPTFLLDPPLFTSPLAKQHRAQPLLAERFEMFIGGREYVNAYTELNDPVEQRRRFAAQEALRERGDMEAMRANDEFVGALEYGLPPTAGIGIGIDRVVMLLSGSTQIRDCILFPTIST